MSSAEQATSANQSASPQLPSFELEILGLIAAHSEITSVPAVHRTTLEAYLTAAMHHEPAAEWVNDAVSGGLRQQLAEALLHLRQNSLLELGERGFQLTERSKNGAGREPQEDQDEKLLRLKSLVRQVRQNWKLAV